MKTYGQSFSFYINALLKRSFVMVFGALIMGCLFINSCDTPQQGSEPVLESNYTSTDSATLLAPGIISTELPEFATTISDNGTEIYFNRTTADRSEMKIFQSIRTNEKWSTPTPLPFSDGQYRDVDPFISQDGNRLYFSSDRPTGQTKDVFNHWYIEKKNNHWSDPILMDPPINSDSTDIFLTRAKNGNAYFRSERLGNRDLFKSAFKDGKYEHPKLIQLTMNDSIVFASNPCISSDEKFLIVFSFNPGGPSAPDLFIAWKMKDKWTNLQNLGPKINTPYTEFAPALSKDDQTLFFTSERPGIVPTPTDSTARPPGDIYQINLQKVVPGFINPNLGKEVTFKSSDGVKVYGDLFVVDPLAPIVIMYHQAGSNARGEYHAIIPKLNRKGYNVLAIDQRVGGQTYGYFNRTVAFAAREGYRYCDALPDLEAALDFALASNFKEIILWGSSYSGSLAIQLAQKRAQDINGVLAFSPASGNPMANCQPDSYLSSLEKPLLIVRPQSEMEIEHVQRQADLSQINGHEVYVGKNGVHGSSILVEERVGSAISKNWEKVLDFLKKISNQSK